MPNRPGSTVPVGPWPRLSTGCSSTTSTASTVATRTGSSVSTAAGGAWSRRSSPSSSTAACSKRASPGSVVTRAGQSSSWPSAASAATSARAVRARRGPVHVGLVARRLQRRRFSLARPRRHGQPSAVGPLLRPQRSFDALLAAVTRSPPPTEILSSSAGLVGHALDLGRQLRDGVNRPRCGARLEREAVSARMDDPQMV